MATTTNFGWTTPDDTALVKDGASAIRTLGSSIDTSMAQLKGGTTGQVLSKTSNTDMAFTWVTQDDANAIQNTIVDAKGDLITATANDTPARLAVGSNDQVLTADSTTATGLKWATPASGGMTLLSTTTLSGATVTISSISTSYKHLFIELIDFLPATAGGVQSRWRVNSDTGSNYAPIQLQTGGSYTTFQAYSLVADNVSSTSTTANYAFMNLYDYANTTTWKMIESFAFYRNNNANSYTLTTYVTQWKGTSAINSISLFNDTGNWTSGTVKIYGVK